MEEETQKPQEVQGTPAAEKEVEKTPEAPVEAPVEQPVEAAPVEQAEAPVEAPVEQPVEAPVEQAEAPVEAKPVEPVAEAPVEAAPIETPTLPERLEEGESDLGDAISEGAEDGSKKEGLSAETEHATLAKENMENQQAE